jgi:hypothetical protein|tara:strand:+ start:1801 stop:4194 length:2394 start_codon:yes stop_codon:yes gene_type:complete
MPVKSTQFKFTSGELDPLLLGRTDIDRYYGAAATMTNVNLLAQGGFKRADGLEFIQRTFRQATREASPTITTPNGGTGANANDDDTSTTLVTTTNISTINPYVVVHYDLGSLKDIAFVDVVGCSLTSATNTTEFFIQASTDNAAWTSLGGALDLSTTAVTRRRAARANYRYLRFVRIGATDLGTDKVTLQEFNVFSEESTVSNTQIIPFEFSVTQSYILVISDKNIAVYRNGTFQADVRANKLTHSIIGQIDYTQSADTAIFVQEDTTPQKLIRQSADDKWLISDVSFDKIPRFDFDPVITTSPGSGTLTPSATEGVITLTASAGTPFSAASVGQYLQSATSGGRARILEQLSTTQVRAVTEIPFYSTTAIANGDWDYLTGFEDVWSSARGYPKTVTFHRSRLYFGGSKQRPQTIWGSKISLFFDFDLGSLFDDDAIDATLDTDQINEIVNIKSSNGNLLVFTTGNEFAVAAPTTGGITPQNFFPVPVSQYGSEKNFRVGIIDNQNIFVQRGGKSIIRYAYDTLQQFSDSENISLLSSHLIDSPVDFAVRKSTSTEESNLVLFIDGTNRLIIGTILLSQQVVGFTQRNTTNSTTGKFKNVAVDVSTIYTIVERTVNSVTNKYVERLNDTALLDSSVIYTTGLPTSSFSGLDHLEGETVKVIADGSVLGDEVVTSGAVTIDRDATTSCEIGLDMTPTVITLPIEVIGMGSKIGLRKRISEVVLRVQDTGDFTINSKNVSFRTFGEAGDGSPSDAAPPVFTGDKKVKGLLGWDERKQITISQDEPAELKVLSLTMNINL